MSFSFFHVKMFNLQRRSAFRLASLCTDAFLRGEQFELSRVVLQGTVMPESRQSIMHCRFVD